MPSLGARHSSGAHAVSKRRKMRNWSCALPAMKASRRLAAVPGSGGRAFLRHLEQAALHRQKRIGRPGKLAAVHALDDAGIELVGLLAHLFQERLRLLGEVDALHAPVDRVGLAHDKTRGFEPVDQATQGDLAEVELVGQLGLRRAVAARYEGQY